MPPKAAGPPGQTYILDVIVNNLELDPEKPEIADYNKLLIQVKIGDEVSFDLTANKVEGKFVKTKIAHEIKANQEQLLNIIELPVNIQFRQAPPEEKPDEKKAADKKIVEENVEQLTDKKQRRSTKRKTVVVEKPPPEPEEEKVEEPNFGVVNIDWQPFAVQRVTDNKFTLHTQYEDKDIMAPLPPVDPEEEAGAVKKPDENDEETEEEPREIFGNISMVIRLQVKPESDRGTLADDEGILNVADEIDDQIDPNDTIFVIGKDVASKYEHFLTQCSDDMCPARTDLNKLRKLHGRLVNTTKVFSPCGNVDCCNDYNSENEDCYCDKVISDIEKERVKNFCYRRQH